VNVNPVPQVEAGTGGLVCQGISLNLQGSGNALFYEWTPSTGLSSPFNLSTTATPDTTTIYTLTGWNQFNCSSSDTVGVRVIPGIDLALDTAFDICQGESVQLPTQILAGPNEPIEFIWTPAYYLDLPQTQNPTANPHTTTTYMVVGSSGDCRPDTAYVTVTVHELPWVNAGQDQTVVAGTTVQLFAEGSSNVTMDWTPDDGFSCDDCFYPEFTAYESGTYIAEVTNEWGCTAEDSVYVRVIEECEGDVLFVPTGFSPNGDGHNDFLRVRSIGLQGIDYFRVFDRWGNLVFETNDIEQSWDGMYKGSPVNAGVFVWVVKAICSNGEETIQKGNVTVLK
jgi:gliding motility-associated-like protein